MGIEDEIKAYSANRRREYWKAYYQAHKEQRHNYYLANREKILARQKAYKKAQEQENKGGREE